MDFCVSGKPVNKAGMKLNFSLPNSFKPGLASFKGKSFLRAILFCSYILKYYINRAPSKLMKWENLTPESKHSCGIQHDPIKTVKAGELANFWYEAKFSKDKRILETDKQYLLSL